MLFRSYYIDFKNAVTSQTIGGVTFFQNAGGAIYKGVETEGTYYAGLGFSLYGNFTINSAKQKGTNDWMPNAPRDTAAFGVIYEHGPLTGSLITKFIGRQYGLTGNQIPIGGYAVTNLATGYTFKSPAPWFRDVRLGFQIDNGRRGHGYGWLLGLRLAAAPHDPSFDAVCRSTTACGSPPGSSRDTDLSVLFEASVLIGR